MKTITLNEAQARLPELVRLVAEGEEFELVYQQRPVAKLVSAKESVRIDWCEAWTTSETTANKARASAQPR